MLATVSTPRVCHSDCSLSYFRGAKASTFKAARRRALSTNPLSALRRNPRSAQTERGFVPAQDENSAQTPSFRLRKGNAEDLPTIKRLVFTEKMNPLGLEPSRFVVAEDVNTGAIKGVGQLKEWPCLYRKQDWRGQVVRALNLKPNWKGELFELASLVITVDSRGTGLGSKIVQELVQTVGVENDVCVLTIEPTIPFYERLGFSVLDAKDVPRPLKPEQFFGNIVAQISVSSKVVVMGRRGNLA
mmetsp:Transcript_3023/g.5122  ORF Transcript_3023/g.5122 Transcript_3023/m.5122 type:complete len:244 (+) Transcript_3023:241-972(+)